MKPNAQALVYAVLASTLRITPAFAQPAPLPPDPAPTAPPASRPPAPNPPNHQSSAAPVSPSAGEQDAPGKPESNPPSPLPPESPAPSGDETSDADLSDVDLSDADLSDADLSDADLEVSGETPPTTPPSAASPRPQPVSPPTDSAAPAAAQGEGLVSTNAQVAADVAPTLMDKVTSPAPAPAPKVTEQSSNLGAQFDLRPYSRPVIRGFGYGGFVQGQYLRSQLSEDQLQQGNIPLNRDQFGLRSARLRLEQGYEFTAYGFELDASTLRPNLLSVRRAEATLLYRGENEGSIAPLIALTAGIIDLPFGFEVAESVRTRLFMERSVASSALFPTQNDVGLRLFGAWKFARYAFALVNGEVFEGSDWPTDPNAAKDLVGRLGGEGHVTKGIHLAGGASFAFGKGFHAGRPAVKDTLLWRDDNQDGIATATEILGVPGSSASPSSDFERFALGADLEFQVDTPIGASRVYGEVYVASNHDRGLVVSDPVVTGVDVRQWGGYVAVSQDITQYAVLALRADLYNPNADVFDQRRGDFLPASQRIITLSPAVGFILPRRARLLAQYDFVDDYLARDLLGVPTDARNNSWTLRLQVEL